MEQAHTTAAIYKDFDDVDRDGDTEEQETGWHMTLKCLCGNGKTLADHEKVVYGKTGYACKICGKNAQFSTGLRSLGNNYFYGGVQGSTTIDGVTYQTGTCGLYKLDRSTYTFTKITEPAKLLMSYTMDAADTYERDGKVYLKDVSGNGYDALVQGTYAAAGSSGKDNTALGFRGDEYGDVLDRVSVTEEGMAYISEMVSDTYSYSFWLYNEKNMDRFTPIIGMYRDEELQKNLYDAVFEWRYRSSPALISHINTSNPWYGELVTGEQYIVKPAQGGGDGSTYALGNGKVTQSAAGIGRWSHWVVIKSGSSVTIYQDGQQKATNNNANNTKTDILSAFEIGGYLCRNWIDSNVRTRLTGRIDDVRIYAGGLTASQVSTLYNGGAADSGVTGTGAVAASGERVFGAYDGDVLSEQKNPILHLKMDELGTVKDYSGNGINAAASAFVANAINKAEQSNRALYFDGRSHVNQTKVTLSDDNTAWLSKQINATGKMTISFWMNADFENSYRMSILGIYDKSGRPMGTFETRGLLGQDVWMDGRFAIAFTAAKPYGGSGLIDEATYEQLVSTPTTPTYDNEFDNRTDMHYGDKQIDTWYHVVGELDAKEGTMALYINGERVGLTTIAANTLDEIGYFMIGQPAVRYYDCENASNVSENQKEDTGRQGWAMRDGFVGTIDDIRIYNTILSAEEVRSLYNAPVEDGYTAAIGALDQELHVGERVTINVGVSHTRDRVFNAGEIVVSFDASKLRFNESASVLGNAKVSVSGNLLKLEDFGEDKSFGNEVYKLVFDAIADGQTAVKLEAASFIHKEQAHERDLLDATLTSATVELSIEKKMYTVNLPSIFEGNTSVTDGEDYTFSVKDGNNFDYSQIKATVNGVAAEVIDNDDGSYTVKNVKGELVITGIRTGKSYMVTFEGNAKDEVTGAGETATYEENYTFALSTESGWAYTVENIQIGGAKYTGYTVSGTTYTIPGGAIKGDIVITVSKSQTQASVLVQGSGAGAADGYDTNAKIGSPYTLTIVPESGCIYAVTATMNGQNVQVKDNDDNTYTIENVTGSIVFTVTREVDTSGVSVVQYLTLDRSRTMWLVKRATAVADGKVPTYNGQKMYWSEKYNAYCFLVIETSLTVETAARNIDIVDGTAERINYQMDINRSGKVDASDAQFVYNMYNVQYQDFSEQVTMEMFLRADVNADSSVNVMDARTIIAKILEG